MYECHIWLNILPSPNDRALGSFERFQDGVKSLKKRLQTWDQWDAGLDAACITKTSRGDDQLVYNSYVKRSSELHGAIVMLISSIAHEFPGSFGIMYSMEDDIENMCSVGYTVHVVRRGIVEERKDTFLSPYWGMIEDPPVEGVG
ncbi:Imm7 family immunity protein [Aeoliella sp. SH292]|uniref:Imm7 family immunity protein n=1 Tax=Aeoliella sp. SH292 TaxID=3454464 RepID=UPI003F966F4E